MPITVHEIGPDGQLVQTTIGEDAPGPAAPAAPAVDTAPDSAPAAPSDAPPAAPAPREEAPPDSAPDVPTSPETTEEEDDEAPPEVISRRVQKRIDRERRLRGEAERKQAALEERLRMLEQGYQRPAPEPPPAPDAPVLRERGDYATDEEWLDARDARLLAQAREQWHLEQLQQRLVQEQQARYAQWATREQTFKQQHPDYETRLQEVLPALSPQLRHGLGDSEMAPELVYHLAHHPDELQRLNGLQPLPLSRALGRLEQQLTAPSRPPSPPPTAKPAPPAHLNGAGSPGPRAVTDLSDSETEAMSQAEWEAAFRRTFPKVR